MDERFESVARAVLAAANGFPGLAAGERFAFASLDERSGLAVFPREGETVEEERRSVTGRVRRKCRWPFTVVLRTGGPGEGQRESAAAWLDSLGRWLEGQSVTVKGRTCRLTAYPALTVGRKLTAIGRAGAPRQGDRPADRTETWVMDMTAEYEITIN